MTALLGMRLAGLAAATLLAGVFAVAASDGSGGGAATSAVPEPAVSAFGGWTVTIAGVAAAVPRAGRPGDCGWLITRPLQGVIHPVLPCGARIFVEYGGRRALTRVVARSPVGVGRQLDLTPRLATALGLEGIRRVRWAFSR